MIKNRLIIFVCGMALLLPAVCSWAVETDDGSGAENLLPESPLGVRQARVERMMRDLEKKFTQLAQVLEKTEKAQADRLIEAFQESKTFAQRPHVGNYLLAR